MKYLAVASLAAVAVANPDGWEAYATTKKVDPTTWSAYEVKPTTSSWASWSGLDKPVKPTPKKGEEYIWEEWNKKPIYTTTVVTAITTYCPEPTKIVHAGKTYEVTKATTITITDCPCTISVPVYTKISTSCDVKPTDKAETWKNVDVKTDKAETWKNVDVKTDKAETWKNVDVKTDKAETWKNVDVKTPAAGYPAPSGTEWANVKVSNSAWAPVAKFTGAANKVNAGAAGLAGVIGAAALLL